MVLPSDTARPDTTAGLLARVGDARYQAYQTYSLQAATTVLGDAATLSRLYDSSATLTTQLQRVAGAPRVVQAMLEISRNLGLRDLERRSSKIVFLPDSVIADSGTYFMTVRRGGQPESVHEGAYATRLRMKPALQDWVILSDHLYPSSPVRKKP